MLRFLMLATLLWLLIVPAQALVGEKAYDITAEDILSGEEVSLRHFEGSYVYLVFFNSQCPPCRNELQYIVDNYYILQQHEVQVLGVAMDRQAQDVRNIIMERGIPFPVVMASPSITMLYEDVRIVPYTFLVDPEGVVAFQHMGRLPEGKLKELMKTLDQTNSDTQAAPTQMD
ncbi:peroxiredoxin family protein [Desulfurispira natronophila]|uniref:Peroxiredoxin n=1 Tax=Desulfurispira natronophila TaxID=682562 RepID=A0A7W7Y590_9BACT|nr:TlpA disulfide reductase family protein [Desulfurispira natronophila]MBB5022264.1 peroxiredoxin [Desulfurispira natronophila]